MVVQAGVEHRCGQVAALLEHLVARHGWLRTTVTSSSRSFPGLLSTALGIGDLAQVVRRARHAGEPGLLLVELELPCQRHHQGAYRQVLN